MWEGSSEARPSSQQRHVDHSSSYTTNLLLPNQGVPRDQLSEMRKTRPPVTATTFPRIRENHDQRPMDDGDGGTRSHCETSRRSSRYGARVSNEATLSLSKRRLNPSATAEAIYERFLLRKSSLDFPEAWFCRSGATPSGLTVAW